MFTSLLTIATQHGSQHVDKAVHAVQLVASTSAPTGVWPTLWASFKGIFGLLFAVYLAPGQMFALLTNYSDRGWYYGIVITLMVIPSYIVVCTAATVLAYFSSTAIVIKYVLFTIGAIFSLCVLAYFIKNALNTIKRFFAKSNAAIPAPVFKRLDLLKTRGGTGSTQVDEANWTTVFIANLTCITNPYVIAILLFSMYDSIDRHSTSAPGIHDVFRSVYPNMTTAQFSSYWTPGMFILIILICIGSIYAVMMPVYLVYGFILYFARDLLGQWFYFIVLSIVIIFLGILFFSMLVKLALGPGYSNLLAVGYGQPVKGIFFQDIILARNIF